MDEDGLFGSGDLLVVGSGAVEDVSRKSDGSSTLDGLASDRGLSEADGLATSENRLANGTALPVVVSGLVETESL